ncbi:uncharacterized protein L969DRAFT_96661 [Mixia osmundae IAM 14324]|uniref:Uncharacterized protein n=1 Tax=Mixia osmundae (strain CBS 9802 / IAM 14324 / JCM 22182 / KY 12970) TaxID=764103 RepID=G7DSY5_MIXOS|nr:uncharacterized protein L969DRAFT_96661 [Mixia osmundae IAM 14324]KEI37088.1 hypothetical protein L969DRAFT_96661 [Mixia osmundae IAM 14324]GAA93695.1 hypothetical protein E5Q_00340 [Mixia osmundae IAM 14324]
MERAARSASNWNSLLLEARAQRMGQLPTWDFGTGRFQVDQGSREYYSDAHNQAMKKEQHMHGSDKRARY